jgi:hypothetical protein
MGSCCRSYDGAHTVQDGGLGRLYTKTVSSRTSHPEKTAKIVLETSTVLLPIYYAQDYPVSELYRLILKKKE